MCLSPCKGCMQLPDPKQFEQAIEVLCLLWNCASVFLENMYPKQNKQGLISPNFFPSARIIISPSSTLVLRPLKTLSMEFRFLRAQTSYFKAGYSYPQYILFIYSYLLRTGVTCLRKQSRFGTEYREYINMLPS